MISTEDAAKKASVAVAGSAVKEFKREHAACLEVIQPTNFQQVKAVLLASLVLLQQVSRNSPSSTRSTLLQRD